MVVRLLTRRNLRLPAGERRWAEVDQTLEAALRAGPRNVETLLTRADVLLAKGAATRARQMLEAAAADQPERVAIRLALASLAEQEGRKGEALGILEEARRKCGD